MNVDLFVKFFGMLRGAILIFFLLFSQFPVAGHNEQDTIINVQYKCPPCGCSSDDLIYDQSGLCPSCSMPLIEVNDKAEFIDRHLTPVFRDGALGIFYPKLIYPIFVVAVLLLVFLMIGSRYKTKSINPFLGSIFLIIALYGFKNQIYGVQNGITGNSYYLFVPISFITAIGPFFYLYVQSMINKNFRWTYRQVIHFIPAVAFWILYVVPAISSRPLRESIMSTPFEPLFGHTEQIISVILGFTFLIIAYSNYRQWIKVTPTNHLKLKRWIHRFSIVMTSLFAIWGFIIAINFWVFEFGITTLTYNPLWIAFTLVLIWFAFEVSRDPKFFLIHGKGYLGSNISLDKGEMDMIRQRLENIMKEEKPYIDPELSLNKLADSLKVNNKYLSALLNTGIGKNFYDFINCYRIEEVKNLLKNDENKNYTIEAIANKAGFKSKSSFNSAFKRHTKMTPREFMKSGN